MILFYKMPYIAQNYRVLKDGMTRQEAIDSADCLKLMTTPDLIPNGGVWVPECYYKDAFPNGECTTEYGTKIVLNYTDIKMCSVTSRKDAFREIKRFMEVNEIQTNKTSIVHNDEGLSISVFYVPHMIENGFGYPTVRFVLLNSDNPEDVPTPEECAFLNSERLHPSKPDRYLQRYFDSKGG